MSTYQVEVRHSIVTTVDVEADSPEAAVQIVNNRSFPLPPRDEWQGIKDWEYAVYNENGDELYREEP